MQSQVIIFVSDRDPTKANLCLFGANLLFQLSICSEYIWSQKNTLSFCQTQAQVPIPKLDWGSTTYNLQELLELGVAK